jgi:transposase
VIGIYIGKNSLHIVGHDKRGAIMLGQVEARRRASLAWEACVGARHVSLSSRSLGTMLG